MAAGGDPALIEIGPGRLWYAPLGTAEPTSASAAMPSAWQAIGYTENGTEVAIEQTVDEVNVAEELDPVAYVNSKRVTQVTLAMAEPTRKRLAVVLGLGAGYTDSAASLEPPDPGTEVGVMLVWDSQENAAANANNIRWVFRAAKPSGTATIARMKSPAKSTLPVVFMVTKPTGAKSFIVYPNSVGQI